jgi:hypothetical protein
VAVVVAVVVVALVVSFELEVLAPKTGYHLLGQVLEKIPGFHLDC